MTSRLLISLSLLLLAWQKVCAQLAPADDFFNSGAQLYISNNVPSALERVETGLKIYPEDEKLKKLEQLLKQQQQQQSQQQSQSQQQQQSQSQRDQQKQNQSQQNQQQNQQQNSQDKKQDEQNQSEQKKDEQQKPPEPPKDADDKQNDEQQDKKEGQPVKPGEMTPEEAKKLLDAQKGREQLLQFKPDGKPRDPTRPVKDW